MPREVRAWTARPRAEAQETSSKNKEVCIASAVSPLNGAEILLRSPGIFHWIVKPKNIT